jgi:putative membrane protein
MLLVLREFPRRTYLLTLLGLFTLVALWAAWEPLHPEDWALENALVVVALAVLVGTYRVLPLSRVSYTLIFLFMCLHEVGSHYTYAEVPYDAWWQALTGSTFNELVGWDRNHYDRLVHFSYGLLLAYPIREVVLRVGELKGFWGYFLPLDVTMSTSMLYELIEWAAAVYFGGELGMAYLGTQGDPWDAHKDMLLASIGAALAMGLTATLNARWQRDFAREWVDSLKVKNRKPLGEDEFARLKRDAGH